MCPLCAVKAESGGDMARRLHVLRLLALIEHPDALPPGAALRLSQEIMSLISSRLRRCDSVTPDGARGDSP